MGSFIKKSLKDIYRVVPKPLSYLGCMLRVLFSWKMTFHSCLRSSRCWAGYYQGCLCTSWWAVPGLLQTWGLAFNLSFQRTWSFCVSWSETPSDTFGKLQVGYNSLDFLSWFVLWHALSVWDLNLTADQWKQDAPDLKGCKYLCTCYIFASYL